MRSRIAHTFFLFFYAIPFMLSLYINYSHASAAPMPQPTDEPVTVIEISDPTATPTTPTATPISTPSPPPAPTPTVTPSPSPEQEQPAVLKDSLVTVKVFDRTDNRVIELTMHDYIIRCVAGEMPATFPMEALKAQAVAARTFTARHMTSSCSSNSKAHVCTYHGCCQAYVSPERMQKNWGSNYAEKLEKITRAVEETDGLVMTYNGEPITVFYFSTSNGYTEACQDVFVKNLPYYTSVKSPGEESAPNYYSYGMGCYDPTPVTMAKLRARIDRDPDTMERLTRALNNQTEFSLNTVDYKKLRSPAPSEILEPWYRAKYFSIGHEEKLTDELFDRSLVERLKQGYEFLLPYYDYFLTLEGDPDPREP